MAKTQKQTVFRWQAYQSLLAATFAVAGVFNMVGAVLAAGTTAGTPITNTATATYDDGNGTSVNATSNTVTINVAEIAGITAVPSGFKDVNNGAIEGTDTLVYDFTVTNTGNDATDIFIPGINNVITSNFDVTAAAGGKIEIFALDGTTLLGTVLAAGGNYSTVTGGGTVPANGQFIVRVTGKIAAGTTANQPVGVTLGNTPPNDNTAATQNQTYNNGGAANDLRTLNVGAVTPANGDREASATESKPFASANNPLALATVLKASSVVGNAPASATDDQITYDLGLRVESTVPAGNLFQAASLRGTPITLNGSTQSRILVSDAIPAGTVLQSVSNSLPVGWTPVYSTVTAAGSDPLTVAWTTTAPTNLATVTRVGFVHLGPLAKGFSTTGLRFTVLSSGLIATGGTVDNIAQAFGATVGDATNEVVYDESGDQNPNNFDGTTPPDATGTNYPIGGKDGVANPANGIDTGNNNTGTGSDGEINRVSIVPPTDDILNGPSNTPGAVGPTDDNDDFTNKSTAVPAGIAPGGTFDPGIVTFNNTLSNPAGSGFLSNVTLQPISPTQAEVADGNATTGQYGLNTDIPNGTIVTITQGVKSAQYTYNAGVFSFLGGTTAHVNVGSVSAGATVNYTVQVDLPTGEALKAVNIPVIAFPDDDPLGSPGYNSETTNNITIDRLYTGFMSLVKTARVIGANGVERLPFTQSFNPATQNILPGEFIEYRIEYANISTQAPAGGAGNVLLNANNFVITENGITGGNTWAASTTTHQQNTVFKAGSTVTYTNVTGPITVNSDPVNGTKVDIYENTVGTVIPGSTNGGAFTFRRQVN